MRIFPTALALFLLGAPGLAHATSVQTMTFTGLPPVPGVEIWLEDGITATAAGGPIASLAPGAPHLDGADLPFGSFIDFTTGSLFDPLSIDVRPSGSGYCSTEASSACNDPLDYIGVTGFLDDTIVGSIGLYRPADDAFETIVLDQLPTMDRLRVEARTYLDLGLPGSCNILQGCGHFNLDNVTLRGVAPAIPEPGAIGLFAIGLLCASRARGGAAGREGGGGRRR